jgi:heme/copper-type cytochrome/quinol oxidase subunit 3
VSQRTHVTSGHQIAEPVPQPALSRGLPSLIARSAEWAPEVDARVVRIGTWMWIGADALFFVAWFFAFFYLRALDNNHDFHTHWILHPRRYIGGIIFLLIAAVAGLYWLGSRALANRRSNGRTFLWLALAAGILCIGFQVYEFGHLGFDPQLGGGYPSVFVGLKGAWLIQVVGAVLWLATHVAQARPGGDFTVRAASAASFGYFLAFLAAINLIAYLVLYFL